MKRKNIRKRVIWAGVTGSLILSAGSAWQFTAAEEGGAREYIFPDSASEYLTAEEVSGLPKQLLAYGKFEILARRGMIFESQELTGYFENQDWYFGFIDQNNFPPEMLNEWETANLEFLQLQEQSGNQEGYKTDQEGYDYGLMEAWLAGEEIAKEGAAENGAATDTRKETELGEKRGEESAAFAKTEGLSEAQTPGSEMQQPEAQIPGSEIQQPEAQMPGSEIQQPEAQIPERQPEAQTPESEAQTVSVSEYIFPDADRRYLTRSEVEALSLQAICYAKNEVYARHGRIFMAQELRDYFGEKSWYNGIIPPEQFSDQVFNAFERENIQVLVACEEAVRADGYQLDQPGYDIHAVNTASKYTVNSAAAAADDAFYLNQDYIFRDSDMRYLEEEEVNALSGRVACYAANEIYARRGALFESRELQEFFGGKTWYSGRISAAALTEDMFNMFELNNIHLLKNRVWAEYPSGYPLY